MPTYAKNRKAFHHYSIEDDFEAGLSLLGHEVKSIRNGKVNLAGAYVTIRNNEMFLRNAHIARYEHAGELAGHDEYRERKLLMHKNEILKLLQKTQEQNLTLVPLEIYTRKKKLKLKIGLAKGKKQYDKRAAIMQKDLKKKIGREIRNKI